MERPWYKLNGRCVKFRLENRERWVFEQGGIRQYVWQGLSRVIRQLSPEEVRTEVGGLHAGVDIGHFLIPLGP